MNATEFAMKALPDLSVLHDAFRVKKDRQWTVRTANGSEYLVSSNGHILIAVPALDAPTVKLDMADVTITSVVQKRLFAADFTLCTLAPPELPPLEECDKCSFGNHDCPTCFQNHDCGACAGAGEARDLWAPLEGGAEIQTDYLEWLVTNCPGLLFELTKPGECVHFVFDFGIGCLMPKVAS